MHQRLSTNLLIGAAFGLSVAVALVLVLPWASSPTAWAQSPQPTPTYTPTPALPPTATLTPTPAPPLLTVGYIAPDPSEPLVMLGELILFTAVFTDPPDAVIRTADWDWGDGTSSTCTSESVSISTSNSDLCTIDETLVTASHSYADPGVYTVGLEVTADEVRSGNSALEFVVVYDPDAGFVTGGGWIDSPAGAYAPDPSLTGVATFGFVSKYKKGASTPDGNTQFQFKSGDLNFHSDSYDWLVVAGAKAMYKGTGTVNGGGSYGFLLSAIDESLTPSTDVDLFRIKIWDKDNGNAVLYDNQVACLDTGDDAVPCTEIDGGSIVIHKAKGK